jgi:tetratricopeptide (TPR) repeat protein
MIALVLLLLLQPNDDIYQRLQRALGESAVKELHAKHFSAIEEQLSTAKPATADERAEFLALRGAVAFLAGDMSLSAASLQESARIKPVREADQFTLAMALIKLGDGTNARQALTVLTKQHQSTALYWYWLGRLDYDQRRYAEAVSNLQQAIMLDPKSARHWDGLGLAWDMQGQMDQARTAFEKAVTLNRSQPNPSPWPPLNLGYLLLRLDRTSESEISLRESLTYDSTLARTHYYLGRVLEKSAHNEEAIAQYKTAINLDTSSADACYSLAMLYKKLHRDEEASAMFAEYRKRH